MTMLVYFRRDLDLLDHLTTLATVQVPKSDSGGTCVCFNSVSVCVVSNQWILTRSLLWWQRELYLKMGIKETLNSPQLVAKFQSFFGVERLPDQIDPDDFETSTQGNDGQTSYRKYVKQRHTEKYVLQDSYKHNNSVNNRDLQTEGVPPFTSDDSDSDNGSWHKSYKITPHRIKYKSIYYAFKFSSFFGDEAFYLTCLPFMTWNVDSYLMRHVVIVWGIAMYCGQVMKDIFQWSRPATPPVVRLDTDFAQEFSMPSTHAVAASSIPLVMAYTMIYRYQVTIVLKPNQKQEEFYQNKSFISSNHSSSRK